MPQKRSIEKETLLLNIFDVCVFINTSMHGSLSFAV